MELPKLVESATLKIQALNYAPLFLNNLPNFALRRTMNIIQNLSQRLRATVGVQSKFQNPMTNTSVANP